ncbi:MAG: hypothetical protein EBX20_11990 [Rhodobacterales bacterium]|nr:hypothetical protein [Rhodobacterales bacterium]
MKVLQSLQFAKAVKKLHANQKSDLDKAVQLLMQDPLIGDRKSGNLGGIRVYKFKMVNQLNLTKLLSLTSRLTLMENLTL